MTESGKAWAMEKAGKKWPSPHIDEQAMYWVGAFVKDVKKRARSLATANAHGIPHDPNFVDYSDAFTELSGELLGEKP